MFTRNLPVVQQRAEIVKEWRIKNIDRATMALPNEDAVWEFITSQWATCETEVAEAILNAAMPEPTIV